VYSNGAAGQRAVWLLENAKKNRKKLEAMPCRMAVIGELQSDSLL
jgi:hypothetical protein